MALSVFPPEDEGFYIGEYNGKPVGSVIRIPWGNIFFGSYYYVDEKYRGKGFGTRIRDEVARKYVGEKPCCIDAVLGTVTQRNLTKFGYILGPKTGHFHGIAKRKVVQSSITIKKVSKSSKCLLYFLNSPGIYLQ